MPSPAPVDSVLHAIGHTPVLRLRKIVPPGSADVVVKLEYFNPTGSYKDRMALAMIEGAEKRGTLRKGMRVVEYTGGSTGSSLAMVCAIKGYEFHPLSSDAFAQEKLDTMRAFGADLEIIQSDGGKVTPALFDKFKARIAELMKDPNTFWTDQFNNPDALDGYANIGQGTRRASRECRCVRRRGRIGRNAGRRIARVERSGQQGAHHRARAVDIAVPHHRQGRAASCRRNRGGILAAALTRTSTTKSASSTRTTAARWLRRAAKEEGVFAGNVERRESRRRYRPRARTRPGQGRRDGRGRHGAQVPRRGPLQ